MQEQYQKSLSSTSSGSLSTSSSSSSSLSSYVGTFFKSSKRKSINIQNNKNSYEDTVNSDSDSEKFNYYPVPFSRNQTLKYKDIIVNEYNTGKFKHCVKISNGLYYLDKKTGHEIFAIKNNTNVLEDSLFNFYYLDRRDVIGEGTQGIVYAAYNLRTREKVAAKLSKNSSSSCLLSFRNEAKYVEKLNRSHGHCTFSVSENCGDTVITKKKKLIFMDYYSGEDLSTFLYHIDKSYDNDSEFYWSAKKNFPAIVNLKLIKAHLKLNRHKFRTRQNVNKYGFTIKNNKGLP